MNISKKLKGLLAACVAAVGLTAFAAPKLTVGEVKTGEPWSTIMVDYMLDGVVAMPSYNVVFDVTAGGQTASVTNVAARIVNGWATQKIDTAKLFGKQVVDTQAKVTVTLIAIKPKTPGVQLWAYGPYWAENNVGAAEEGQPAVYGAVYNFADAAAAVAALGDGWRLPTKAEFSSLCSNCDMKWHDQNGVGGTLVTGRGDYSTNSIFLPEGYYWSSTEMDMYVDRVWGIAISKMIGGMPEFYRCDLLSVRAVRGYVE